MSWKFLFWEELTLNLILLHLILASVLFGIEHLPQLLIMMMEVLQASSNLLKNSLKYSSPWILYLHKFPIDLGP